MSQSGLHAGSYVLHTGGYVYASHKKRGGACHEQRHYCRHRRGPHRNGPMENGRPCGGSMCCAIGSWGRGACPRVGSYVKRAPEPAPPGAAPRWTPFMAAMLLEKGEGVEERQK